MYFRGTHSEHSKYKLYPYASNPNQLQNSILHSHLLLGSLHPVLLAIIVLHRTVRCEQENTF